MVNATAHRTWGFSDCVRSLLVTIFLLKPILLNNSPFFAQLNLNFPPIHPFFQLSYNMKHFVKLQRKSQIENLFISLKSFSNHGEQFEGLSTHFTQLIFNIFPQNRGGQFKGNYTHFRQVTFTNVSNLGGQFVRNTFFRQLTHNKLPQQFMQWLHFVTTLY